MCPQKALEPIFLKEYLTQPLLNGGKIEIGLSDDEPQLFWLDVEALLAEEMVPDGLLVVPVDEVAPLEGQHVEEGGKVTTVLNLITNKGATLLRLGLHDAVWKHSAIRNDKIPLNLGGRLRYSM
jgi:hypothetical protein